MEISLFQNDEPMRFERIVIYPYPDLKRIWARLWIAAQQDATPNIDLSILNPDGSEDSSISLLAQSELRIEKTIHMRDPVPGAIYRVVADLTHGMGDAVEALDHQEFEMVLEFRNPERNEPGFGMGVDWEEFARNA